VEDLTFRHDTRRRAPGNRTMAITGVVASGNLEVLTERVLPDA
jgi:malonate decarboxylase delta subunit